MDETAINKIIYSIFQCKIKDDMELSDLITEDELVCLCHAVNPIFDKEPVLLELNEDIYIVGDIHGKLDDLIRIFERCNYPPDTKYLFLGDYIDRGQYSVEVICLLFALKIKYPNHIYLLRGNHETQSINKFYGFFEECLSKFSQTLYFAVNNSFQYLPVAAVVNEAAFCVHGGISPMLKSLNDLRKSEKQAEISGPGLFTDLLWSDPVEYIDSFAPNDRGCGYFYGMNVINQFLEENDLELIVRSHELCPHGLKFPIQDFQKIVTVFSNTNYCCKNNSAAIIHISKDLNVTNKKFHPIDYYSSQKQNRRIIFPKWLFNYIAELDKINDDFSGSEPELSPPSFHQFF